VNVSCFSGFFPAACAGRSASARMLAFPVACTGQATQNDNNNIELPQLRKKTREIALKRSLFFCLYFIDNASINLKEYPRSHFFDVWVNIGNNIGIFQSE
jgi:hypothetical protein